MPFYHKKRISCKSCFLIAFALALLFSLVQTQVTQAELLRVSASKARIRNGPGSEFTTAWEATTGYPLKALGSKGDWIHVQDLEKDEGWVHKTLVQKADIVVVSGKILNVRKGPGTKFPVIMKCEHGVVLKKLSEQKGWIKVKHADGEEGYVYASMVWQ